MNAREFVQALQGQNPESTVLILTGDQFYELDHVATPVAEATVIVVAPEVSTHPAAESSSAAMDLTAPKEDTAPALESEADTAPSPDVP